MRLETDAPHRTAARRGRRRPWRFFPLGVVGAMAVVVAVNAGMVYAALRHLPRPGRRRRASTSATTTTGCWQRRERAGGAGLDSAARAATARPAGGDAGRSRRRAAARRAGRRRPRNGRSARRRPTQLGFRDAGAGPLRRRRGAAAPGQWDLTAVAPAQGHDCDPTRRDRRCSDVRSPAARGRSRVSGAARRPPARRAAERRPTRVCAPLRPAGAAGRRFCCPGCAAAFETIQALGLGRYYAQRVLDPALRAPRPGRRRALGPRPPHRHRGRTARHELTLAVDGLQCGACVWLIESVLAREPASLTGRVNMTTRRLRLVWRGARRATPSAWSAAIEAARLPAGAVRRRGAGRGAGPHRPRAAARARGGRLRRRQRHADLDRHLGRRGRGCSTTWARRRATCCTGSRR